jgi:predicted Rossmann fold flavoprotein
MKQNRKIIVVGAGASGIAAALAAANSRADVTLLERMNRIGKKLLVTGNGRCNLENTNAKAEYYTGDRQRISEVLKNAPPKQIIEFFEGLGLLCKILPDGRVYPYCCQASMVVDILRLALERRNVKTECGCEIKSIVQNKNGFTVTAQDGREFSAQRVILSAGGKASPAQGSNGSGFSIAKELGHMVTTLYPCLVPLKCGGDVFPGLKGLRAENCRAALYCGKKLLKEDTGEVLFTDSGVSGIPIFQLSTALGCAGSSPVTLKLDFFPNMDLNEVKEHLLKRRKKFADLTLENFLLGTLAKKIAYAILKSCGCAPLSRKVSTLTDLEISKTAQVLKGWSFTVTGTSGWNSAQVTGGGIPLSEIDTRTCESLRRRGLYLCGEILDAVGDCGGFNLHWAWCTGLSAGYAAAK